MATGSARRPVQPVDRRSFTDAMEQLQEGYVFSVAATVGCQADLRGHGNRYGDVLITRAGVGAGEEVSLYAHLKCTTTITPDHTKGHFGYRFNEREHFDMLAKERRRPPKHLLVVMAAPKEQRLWTDAGADHLKVLHCCYWASLEGTTVDERIAEPTVHVATANIFDAAALTWILDRLDRGEPLR